jgi:hypothetical protein
VDEQVLVPGKQNYSLAIAWALDHDPVEAVQDVLERTGVAEEEGISEEAGPSLDVAPPDANGSSAAMPQPTSQMRRSASAAESGEVHHVCVAIWSCRFAASDQCRSLGWLLCRLV